MWAEAPKCRRLSNAVQKAEQRRCALTRLQVRQMSPDPPTPPPGCQLPPDHVHQIIHPQLLRPQQSEDHAPPHDGSEPGCPNGAGCQRPCLGDHRRQSRDRTHPVPRGPDQGVPHQERPGRQLLTSSQDRNQHLPKKKKKKDTRRSRVDHSVLSQDDGRESSLNIVAG